jgi:septal ring factor EnvC (AmiA/AmiB activator)
VSQRRQESLRAELEGVESDRAKLGAELIATAQRIRRTEDEIRAVETRLDQLHANEDGIRSSLRERRAVMADVLMALQRMGRTPPPAILSRPEDALAAIRGSILAGAVLPDIRIEAEALAADLAELTELTARIQSEHEGLRARYTSLGEEQARIDFMVASKQARREQMDADLAAEAQKAQQLAGEAVNLQQLVRSLETEVAASAQASAEAEKATRSIESAGQAEAARRLADTSRIAPAIKFVNAKGMLTLPVSGDRKLGFGDPDGLGGTSQGISLRPVLARPWWRRRTDGWCMPGRSGHTVRF